MPERIGLVGLGITGRPTAVNLPNKFEVVGLDVQQSCLDGLAGITRARTVAAEGRTPIPMTAAAHEIFVAGQAAGHAKSPQSALFELWARQGGA